MRNACPALAIGVIVSMTRLARAEATSLPLELEWAAPPDCPDAPAVRRRIETLVHGPVAARSNAVAHGNVESTGDGRFRLAVTVRTGDVADEREIDSASCAMLAEAFAVVVALAINPTKAGGTAEEPPPERSSPEPTPRPSPPVPDASASPVAPADVVHPNVPLEPRSRPPERRTVPPIAFGLGTSVVWGTLPEASGGLVASVGVRLDRFRFGLLGTVAFGQRASFDRSAGASIDMVEGGAFGAYMLPLGIVSLGPCANVEATYVRVEGFGIRAPRASSSMWATPVVGGRLEVAAARWLALVARADLLFPIDASRIALGTTTDTVQLHSPAAVSPRLTLGAEFVLP